MKSGSEPNSGFIPRRRFVVDGIQAALACSLIPRTLHRAAEVVSAPTARRGRQASQIAEFERLIAQLMADAVVPGASVAVIQDGRVVWSKAFGVRDATTRAPVDEHTVFEAASVSKTVFAYAVMQLHDRRTLSLDTPLTTYTTDRILDGDPRLNLITARHVLSHTSGLPNFRTGAEPLRIHFTPGEKYQYSGEGYWYLQSVVTRLVGTTDPRACGTYEAGMKLCASDIDAYLRTNVLAPCRMASSGYVWNEVLERNGARPHDSSGKALTLGRPTATDAARYAAMGGLRTTAMDYANFLIEVMAPRATDAFRLTGASRQEMVRPHVKADNGKSWALGWEIRHTPRGNLIQHQGGQSGVQAFAAASLERQSGYVVLTNSDNGWKVFFNERFTAAADRLLLG